MKGIRNIFNSGAAQMLVLFAFAGALASGGQNGIGGLPWNELTPHQKKVMGLKKHLKPEEVRALSEWIEQRRQYWLTPPAGVSVSGATVKAIFVVSSDREHPGAVLFASNSYVAIRPGAGAEQKEFASEADARQWVEGPR